MLSSQRNSLDKNMEGVTLDVQGVRAWNWGSWCPSAWQAA
jgi:hypothetical protein